MSSVECLREFVNERLTAAAEEIFGVFKQAIVKYEEEIDRQRRLLDIVWKPEIRLNRIELPQQNVCKEEDVFADQPRFDQERNSSSLNKEEPEPLQIKEEEEELYTSQEGELLVLSGPGTFVVPPTKLKSDQQDLFNNSNVAESQDQKESEHGSTGTVEPKPKKRHKKSKRNHYNIRPTFSEIHCNTRIKFSCDVCGKDFKQKSKLNIHLKRHTSEESHICKTCGKCCKKLSNLREHVKIHAGGKQYSCDTCGKTFSRTYELKIHKRTHTDEKPYGCVFCGKRFSQSSAFKRHMSSHTGEKLYTCKTCGRAFTCPTYLMVHMRMHTGEKEMLATLEMF